MSTRTKTVGGSLYSLLNDNSQHKQTILEIEAFFSIDEAFPAAKALTIKLALLLMAIDPGPKQTEWYNALTEISTTNWVQEYKGIPEVKTPISGYANAYHLADFFLQTPHQEMRSVAQSLQEIFLSALLKKTSKNKLNRIPKLLRRTISVYDIYSSTIESLPWMIYGNFTEEVRYVKKSIELTPKESFNRTISIIKILIQIIYARRYKKPKKSITPPPKTDEQQKLPPSATITKIIDGQPNIGALTVHSFQRSQSLENESPEFIDLFSASPDESPVNSAENTSNDLLATEEEIDQQSQESRYWLIRHEKIVPTDYGRFTMPERTKIIQFINDKIVSTDHSLQTAAGLIGTMYLTGLSLEDLLNSSFGDDQTFKEAGGYRRNIRMPREGFVPDEIQMKYISAFTTELNLQLPEPIASWLGNLYMPQGTIGKSLNLELEDAKQYVYTALKVLREKGCYQRIRAERIPAALTIETTLMFRDPLITFLLAAKSTQAAPKLSYYATHSASKLTQCYEQVTKKMVLL